MRDIESGYHSLSSATGSKADMHLTALGYNKENLSMRFKFDTTDRASWRWRGRRGPTASRGRNHVQPRRC
jgi:hypothetical protein